VLERRVELLGVLRQALSERDVLVRIGTENAQPELRGVAFVAAAYGLPARRLGHGLARRARAHGLRRAIVAVRDAARQLSRYVETVYDEG
jgi:hypothetical protein